MSLRDQVTKFFARPKETNRNAWERAKASPQERAIAEAERETQLRELAQRQAADWNKDLAKERQEISLEHLGLDYKPDSRDGMRADWQIERQAVQSLQAKNEQQRQRIREKSVPQLVTDAKDRASEQERATKADQQHDRHAPVEVKERGAVAETPEPYSSFADEYEARQDAQAQAAAENRDTVVQPYLHSREALEPEQESPDAIARVEALTAAFDQNPELEWSPEIEAAAIKAYREAREARDAKEQAAEIDPDQDL